MEYQKLIERSKSRKKNIKATLDKLSKMPVKQVDEFYHEEHELAFEKINCLKCANCCKTTGPLFTSKDIERIAQHLKIKPGLFIDQYLRIDEDKDYVLQKTPCIFLDEQNYCSIYSVRPRACAEFPHTDRKNMKEISNLTFKNSQMCPAVAVILENIEQKIKS